MNRENKTIKNNKSVLQIFKLFIQLKGDFGTDGGWEVVNAVLGPEAIPAFLSNTYWSGV